MLAASNVLPQQRTYELRYLLPGAFYVLDVTAHSDAGDTQQEYLFSTLSPNGGERKYLTRHLLNLIYAS